tara:strand:- start:295 stop:600 length:306 start_codon:yes stop_codon:yes gene_type:complete
MDDKKKPGTKSRKGTGRATINPKTCVFTNAKGEKRQLTPEECKSKLAAKKRQFEAKAARAKAGTTYLYEAAKKGATVGQLNYMAKNKDKPGVITNIREKNK